MKIYQGHSGGDATVQQVFVSDPKQEGEVKPLDPRLDLRNHSPTGLSWGYGGSGPAQLALALLADACGDDAAVDMYQDFKFAYLGRIPMDTDWVMSESVVQMLALKLVKNGRQTWPG